VDQRPARRRSAVGESFYRSPAPLTPIADKTEPALARLGRSSAAVIAALLASTFVVILSETTMGVTTPVLIRELAITLEAAQ
jgi:hypothetical protein